MFTYITHAIVAALVGVGALFGIQNISTQPEQLPQTHSDMPSHQKTQAQTVQTPSTQTKTLPASNSAVQTHSQASVSTLPTGSGWLAEVPLGDGKYVTTAAKKGYIYVCHVASGGQGANVNGPWIHGSSWTPAEKVKVQGSVSWPQATYSMSVTGTTRSIKSNDLPTNQTTGIFPIAASDPAAQYDRNGSGITAQTFSVSVPSQPSAASSPACIYGQVGVMNNGVFLYDAFDALYRDALAHEEQDAHDGHPNDHGYHMHGFITDIRAYTVSQVVGFAFDGFPITGPLLPNGNFLHTADLDQCHGITSTVTLDGKDVSTYHYVLTQDFPYSVGCFRGTSYEPKPGAGGQGTQQNTQQPRQGSTQNQNGGRMPPQEAVAACSGKTSNSSCSFTTPNGTVTGACRLPPNTTSLACVPN